MKTEQRSNSCTIDSDNLDDWLESDLRQSGILPFDNNNMKSYNNNNELVKNEDEIPSCGGGSNSGFDDKTIVDENEMDLNLKTVMHMDTLPSSPPPPLIPILKALVTLNSLQQQGFILPTQQQSYSTYHVPAPLSPPLLIPDAINPLHVSKTPAKRNNISISPRPIQQDILPLKNSIERKRQMELTDTLDPVTLKRMKNTDAARRSRLRKVMKMEKLESRVIELEKQNQLLLRKVTEAEQLRDDAKLKESSQHEKMVALEAELELVLGSLGSHAPSK